MLLGIESGSEATLSVSKSNTAFWNCLSSAAISDSSVMLSGVGGSLTLLSRSSVDLLSVRVDAPVETCVQSDGEGTFGRAAYADTSWHENLNSSGVIQTYL